MESEEKEQSTCMTKIRRSRFSASEDRKLQTLVKRYGTADWTIISENIPHRSPRQCRDRWNHYISPQANTSEWLEYEDEIIIDGLKKYGKHWTYIASLLPGRSSVAVRNRSCKISRRADADPFVKELLKDEYKNKKNRVQPIEQSSNNESEQQQQIQMEEQQPKVKLPSCIELIEKAGMPLLPVLI